jgi:hypothetical protein
MAELNQEQELLKGLLAKAEELEGEEKGVFKEAARVMKRRLAAVERDRLIEEFREVLEKEDLGYSVEDFEIDEEGYIQLQVDMESLFFPVERAAEVLKAFIIFARVYDEAGLDAAPLVDAPMVPEEGES